MRRMVGIILACTALSAQAQLGVTDVLRSLSGALRGGEPKPQKQEGVTPVMGVRGIDEADSQQAGISRGEDYVLMEGWAATRPEALRAAEGKNLLARPVTFQGEPQVPSTGN